MNLLQRWAQVLRRHVLIGSKRSFTTIVQRRAAQESARGRGDADAVVDSLLCVLLLMIRIIYNFVLVHLLLLLVHILVVVRILSHMVHVLVLNRWSSARILPRAQLLVLLVRSRELRDLHILSLVLRVASWLLSWVWLEALLRFMINLDSLAHSSLFLLRRWQGLSRSWIHRQWLLVSILLVDKIVFDVLFQVITSQIHVLV